jgi:precorrin-2 dehydrogenase / sirohydrochlorin ferrochelatase
MILSKVASNPDEFLPIQLRLSGRFIVIIGGGAVGRRKARAVLQTGARVRLVALDPPPADFQHQSLHWIQQEYRSDHLEGAELVFAAGPKSLNLQVVQDARQRGIWVNDAANPSEGDFLLPAVGRSGLVTVTVDTSGTVPGAAAALRDLLINSFDGPIHTWIELLAEYRARILLQVRSEIQRQELIREMSDCRWIEHIRSRGVEDVRQDWEQMLEHIL